MPSVVVSTDAGEHEWDRFVDAQAEASVYHQWRWRGVFERTFGHRCEYLVARREGVIAGVLPLVIFRSWIFGNSVVSLPFVNYGGVLTADDEAANALVYRATGVARQYGARHLELRHRARRFPNLAPRAHKVAMLLELAPRIESAWARLDRKVRNQIRKAERSGFSVTVGGADLLDDFYAVFARNMRDLGTPVYARRFFTEIIRHFPAQARVFVVRNASAAVAAGLALEHRRMFEMPWASSLREHRADCPNVLLYWTAIRHAIAAGFASFDFGRSTPGGGTFKFKEQWGACPAPLHWEYDLLSGTIPQLNPENARFRAAIEMWKRLPLPVATAIGPRVVRSIPS